MELNRGVVEIARRFLTDREIEFEEPCRIRNHSDGSVEVIFKAPGADDPELVVDSPEVRVLVRNEEVELLLDM